MPGAIQTPAPPQITPVDQGSTALPGLPPLNLDLGAGPSGVVDSGAFTAGGSTFGDFIVGGSKDKPVNYVFLLGIAVAGLIAMRALRR